MTYIKLLFQAEDRKLPEALPAQDEGKGVSPKYHSQHLSIRRTDPPAFHTALEKPGIRRGGEEQALLLSACFPSFF